MHGFRVTLQAEVREVEATTYEVDDDGALTLYGSDLPVGHWGPDEWLMIDEFGTRLTDTWPPTQLDDLVDEVATLLAVGYGHYIQGLADADAFADWRCNDVDSLTLCILERVGLTSDSAVEHAAVRDTVERRFHLKSR